MTDQPLVMLVFRQDPLATVAQVEGLDDVVYVIDWLLGVASMVVCGTDAHSIMYNTATLSIGGKTAI